MYDDRECRVTPDKPIDHALLIVGFGVDPVTRVPYWRAKNSWGPRWGEDGYVRFRRRTGNGATATAALSPGVCGLASYPAVAVGGFAVAAGPPDEEGPGSVNAAQAACDASARLWNTAAAAVLRWWRIDVSTEHPWLRYAFQFLASFGLAYGLIEAWALARLAIRRRRWARGGARAAGEGAPLLGVRDGADGPRFMK